jgi:hypothetical protein
LKAWDLCAYEIHWITCIIQSHNRPPLVKAVQTDEEYSAIRGNK